MVERWQLLDPRVAELLQIVHDTIDPLGVDYAIGGALANDPDAVRRRMVEFLDPTGEDLAEWDATIERFKQKRKRRSKLAVGRACSPQ
jgi:hypothetical protein